jgi:hypothetical protein
MYNYHGIPMHPIVLFLVFAIGTIGLFYIIRNNNIHNGDEKNIIKDVYFVYPITAMLISTLCIAYLMITGNLLHDLLSSITDFL